MFSTTFVTTTKHISREQAVLVLQAGTAALRLPAVALHATELQHGDALEVAKGEGGFKQASNALFCIGCVPCNVSS